jgi:hypothetical protein
MAQAAIRRRFIVKARPRFQFSPGEICGAQGSKEKGFFSEYFGFLVSVSFRQFSILIFICMLLLTGQTGKAQDLSKKKMFFFCQKSLDVFSLKWFKLFLQP